METYVSKIEKIRYPISEEMKKFGQFFKFYMKSKVPMLDVITNYIIRCNGKQMRPMFVFLSAKLSGEITPSTYVAASLIELLHTASLMNRMNGEALFQLMHYGNLKLQYWWVIFCYQKQYWQQWKMKNMVY